MPKTQNWARKSNVLVKVIEASLRGVAQVVFMDNSISGLFVVAGMFVSSWYQTLCMLLGVTVATATGLLLDLNRDAFHSGIWGYNGVLVGTGISVFHFGSDNEPLAMSQIVGPIVVLSMCSTVFVAGIGRLFVGKFEISPYTIPFCILVWVWFLGASAHFSYFPVNGMALSPRLNVNPKEYEYPVRVEYTPEDVMKAIPIGVA
jgi:urea transporter